MSYDPKQKNIGDTTGFGQDQIDYQAQIDELSAKLDLLNGLYSNHFHCGLDVPQVQITNLFGLIETVKDVPNYTPNTMYDQIKIYVGPMYKCLYIYDVTNSVWNYVILT